MFLPSEWLCELLTARLSMEREGSLRFSITEPIQTDEFHSLINAEFDEQEEEGIQFVLTRRDINSRVKFGVYDGNPLYYFNAIF
ncbi:hypothetical protein PFISCL1PPCAC_18454, partial [Pristionchus fissidentatus]